MHYIPSCLGFESSYTRLQPRNGKGRRKTVYTYISALKIEGTLYNAMKV